MSTFSRHLSLLALSVLALASSQAHGEDAVAAAAVKEFQTQPRPSMPFFVTQPEWTPAIEDQYSAFVQKIGRGIARRPMGLLKRYMRDPSVNPYASTDPADLVLYSDCADFPYFLRTYFAYKNGLPMSIAYGVEMNQQPYASEPTRNSDLPTAKLESSPYGNFLTSRTLSNVPAAPGREKNYLEYWSTMLDAVSTRTFRVGPLSPNYNLSDIYPVRIDHTGIRPGTIVHSNGHVLVVYDVDAKGIVHVMDAHPDNSNQIKIVEASTLDRSRPDHGFGFFRFRPMRLVGGQIINGAIYGSRIVLKSDLELYNEGLYSLEQWFGKDTNVAPGSSVSRTAWKQAFTDLNFFDFLRIRMRGAGAPSQPADDAFGDQMKALCDIIQQRPADIDQAIAGGMTALPHPDELPPNIFNAEAPWETYSTPSRDGRIRFAAADLPRQAILKFKQGINNQFGLSFQGSAEDFQRSLVAKVAQLNRSCQLTYTKSDQSRVTMTFSDMIRRLPRMSFDPYHCTEKPWGATGQELQSCVDGDQGNRWYVMEQTMRNTVGKQDENERLVVRSDRPITIDMLASHRYTDQPYTSPINLGSLRTPIVDIETYFGSPQFLIDLNR